MTTQINSSRIDSNPKFVKPWQKRALAIFVTAWSTMLLPLLLWPDSLLALLYCVASLFLGGAAIIGTIVSELFQRKPRDRKVQ